MARDNKQVSMSGLKADSYHLTPTLIKKLLKGGRNTLLKKGQILDGVGALFIGNPPGRSKQALTFLIKEAETGLLADLGGRYDPHHKNSIEVLQDEVYEESAKTLQIVAHPNGHLILNQKIDLTEHPGIVLDTFGHRGNKVYRVFVFDIGNEYTSDIFNPVMLRRSHKLLLKEKVDPKYLETTDGQHITLRSIKMCLDKGEDCKVSNMNRCTGELRPRTARIFYILFTGGE